MSVFNGDDNQDTSNAATKQDKENQSFVSQLVKARGEQWSDPEVIAKGKLESDRYIEELKKQLEEAQEKASKGAKADELLSKIEQEAAQTASANAQSKNSGTEESNTKTPAGDDEIQSLIEKALTKREQENTVKQNLEQVNSQLESLYGTEADSIVQKKAQELGLSKQRLQEVASESPTAFFSLLGEKPKDFKPMVQGTIRTESVGMQSPNKRNNSYYQELRRKNPREFAKLQGQMVQDRIKLGDDFYK